MSAVIRANGFDRFRAALADDTDEQVTAAEAPGFAAFWASLVIATDEQLVISAGYWRDRTGFIAEGCRCLVEKQMEYRASYKALVAAMAPPTRWEAKR